MITSKVLNARVAAIATAVPTTTASVADLEATFGSTDIHKVTKTTGVIKRRIASPGLCTSDLCLAAALKILEQLQWDPSTVRALIFVSQTPDYRLPATACVLHSRLGLSKSCAAFDVNLGCSGYVYGLWLAGQMMQSSGIDRVLVLAGDTSSHYLGKADRSTVPIFGDAGTATALEARQGESMTFALGTDGSGAPHLIIPAGASRQPADEATRSPKQDDNGNWRTDEQLRMDGTEVFAFTLREVPKLVEQTLCAVGWSREMVSQFVFHQANRFMLDHLAKKMGLASHQVPVSLPDYGNTSSASIPLTISSCLRDVLAAPLRHKLVLAGFGVGWSWGACALEIDRAVLPPILEVGDS